MNNELEERLQTETDHLTKLKDYVRECKKDERECKADLANAVDKKEKADAKQALAKAKIELETAQDKCNAQETLVDSLEDDIAMQGKAGKSAERKENSVKNVVAVMEDTNAYYISSKTKWYGIYTNTERAKVQTAEWSNEQMKDIILTQSGWVETNDLTIKKIAQENGRMFIDVERNFSPGNKRVLNQLSELRKFWLKPVSSKNHHEAFDILLLSICDGETDYKEQLEKYIAYRYCKPEDIYVPNIDSCATGGTGRDTLFKIIQRIFTAECCGEANSETFNGTHNGELWGKIWIKISERDSKAIAYEEFKNLTGAEDFRLRRMQEDARQADRTFVFMIFNNGYHSTIPVTGGGKFSEDRRVEPIFAKTNLVECIMDHYGCDAPAASEILQKFQKNIYNNDDEVSKWLGYIIDKHKPESIDKLLPLHGKFYDMKVSRQKNALNEFMETIMSLSIDSNCYCVDDMCKIFQMVSGSKISKNSFGKKMCEWLIKQTKEEWVVNLRNVYLDATHNNRLKKTVVVKDIKKVVGSNANMDVFNVYDFINEDIKDDKGKELGRKPHVSNIKDELL